MAERAKTGRCKVCRTWVPAAVGLKTIAYHRVPAESGSGTEKCRGSNTQPIAKRGKW